MVLKRHCAVYLLLLSKKKNWWIFHAFEKVQDMTHLRDVIEARRMIDVVKLLDFWNLYIQFYVLSKYLYDMIFFQICKIWGQKLYHFAYGSLYRELKLLFLTYRWVMKSNVRNISYLFIKHFYVVLTIRLNNSDPI